MSAILLDEDYYNLLLRGRTALDDVSILSPVYLIPFKVKAWLDLTALRAQGRNVDASDIKKHKNDVVRLSTLLTGRENCVLPKPVYTDIKQFVTALVESPVEPKSLHLRGIHSVDILRVLQDVYLLHSEEG